MAGAQITGIHWETELPIAASTRIHGVRSFQSRFRTTQRQQKCEKLRGRESRDGGCEPTMLKTSSAGQISNENGKLRAIRDTSGSGSVNGTRRASEDLETYFGFPVHSSWSVSHETCNWDPLGSELERFYSYWFSVQRASTMGSANGPKKRRKLMFCEDTPALLHRQL